MIERSILVCETDEFIVDASWLPARLPVVRSRTFTHSIASHEKNVLSRRAVCVAGVAPCPKCLFQEA